MKNKRGKDSGRKGEGSLSPSDSNQLKQLSKQNKKYKRTIKSLKRIKTLNDDSSDNNNDDNDNDIDASNQFGGRATKHSSKQKKNSKH